MSEDNIYDNMPQEDMEYSIASQISYDYYDNGNDAQKTQEILDKLLLSALVWTLPKSS